MKSRFQQLRRKFPGEIQLLFRSQCSTRPTSNSASNQFSYRIVHSQVQARKYNHPPQQISRNLKTDYQDCPNSDVITSVDNDSIKIQNLLRLKADKGIEEIAKSLSECTLHLSEDLVLNVLKRHRSDWRPAYTFFIWVSKGNNSDGFLPGTGVYNEMLDILGRMHRFDELTQVLDEMSKRKVLVNDRTYSIVMNRYAAAHKIEEAIQFFYKRKELGLQLDLIAFQTLLLSLCRYKHVEAAEVLFHNKKNEFKYDTKTWNIILNGWCVLGNLREAKRFWNDIVTSKCKPDKFTYGVFINSLCKAGKISTAVKLFQAMWEKGGCKPDVAICNCIIDGLCFKKRIPEALEIFQEMNGRGCSPNVATYNSLIRHLCKIKRMDKVYEFLDEMEMKGEGCLPNARTYGYLLNSSKNSEEVYAILERMEMNGCKLVADTYNLLLRLFMGWGNQDRVKATWQEMERRGLGPDQRSYTTVIHGMYDKGMMVEALRYFQEMISKEMVPEPRTKLLVDAIKIKLNSEGSSNITEKKVRSKKPS